MKKTIFVIIILIVPMVNLTIPTGAMAQKPSGNKGNTEAIIVGKSQIVRDKKNNKLKFISDEGKISNEISLNEIKSFKVINGETIEIKIGKYANISGNRKFVVFIETPLSYRDDESSKFKLIDYNDKILFEKQLKNGKFVDYEDDIVISENGEKIVIGSHEDEGSYPMVTAYDRSGSEIFSFPNEKEKGFPIRKIIVSPNGQYVGFAIDNGAIFWDLKKKIYWRSNEEYYISSISDSGLARVLNIKKRNTTIEFLDLSKYIR